VKPELLNDEEIQEIVIVEEISDNEIRGCNLGQELVIDLDEEELELGPAHGWSEELMRAH
jgi:hypothetical protein